MEGDGGGNWSEGQSGAKRCAEGGKKRHYAWYIEGFLMILHGVSLGFSRAGRSDTLTRWNSSGLSFPIESCIEQMRTVSLFNKDNWILLNVENVEAVKRRDYYESSRGRWKSVVGVGHDVRHTTSVAGQTEFDTVQSIYPGIQGIQLWFYFLLNCCLACEMPIWVLIASYLSV